MSDNFEIAIIGAGPAGLGAATNAAHHKLLHVLFEKREIGNTVYDYQLRKHVMSEPAKLPLRSHVPFEAGTREKILEVWNKTVAEKGVNIRRAEVTKIEKLSGGFKLHYGSDSIQAKYVILCIGVQGCPRELGVPGDKLPHVAYTLADPDAFQNKDIIIVGAGDAAIENALALMDENRVALINKGGEFARAKDANNAAMLKAIDAGKIRCFYNSETARVEQSQVFVNTAEGEVALPCDHLIARIGAILPRKFLEGCGINFPNRDPNSVPVVNQRFESNVPGLFILGALIGYPLIKQAINQGFEVIQHIVGQPVEPADQVLINEKLLGLPGDVNENLAMIRKSLPLFADLSEPQFRELIIESKIHLTKVNDVIFERNDYTDTFFSVVSGSTKIELPNGKHITVPPGNFFGEMGILSGRRRSATVKALEAGIVLESPRKQIIKLISSVESVKRSIDEKFMRNALETSIFPDVDPEFIKSLAGRARFKNFKKGEVLFREGDQGDVLYVIRKGSVKISRKNSVGTDTSQAYVAAGNFVGEMALISELVTTRNATVTAAVSCETVTIEKSDFTDILQRFPEAKRRIVQVAEERRVQNITFRQESGTGQAIDFMIGQGLTDADNVLVIDSDLCIACDNCEKACAATHAGYSRLDRKGGKSLAAIQIPISCRHCENPLCMTDCPPDALLRLPNGEVIIQDSCIGCGNCVRNCPYGVIQMVYDKEPSGFSLLSLLGLRKAGKSDSPAKAAKCDMCSALGGGPACVRACPTGAAMRINPTQLVTIIASKESRGV